MVHERPIAEAVPGLDKTGDARRTVSSKLSVLRKHPFFCDLEPEALAFHKEVSEEQVKVLYRGTGKTAYRA